MNEIEILNNTIHNLEKSILINWDWKNVDYKKDKEVDGELSVILNHQKKIFFVEIKTGTYNVQLKYWNS